VRFAKKENIMGTIVAAIASSHAFAVLDPERWDELRERNRKLYVQRQGREAPSHPRLEAETKEDIAVRYGRVRDGLRTLRHIIEESRPDVLLVIGDDQNEDYTVQNVPQFAIYTGPDAVLFDRLTKQERSYECDAEAARAILEGVVEAGFDVSFSQKFPENRLISHAHTEPLMRILLPDAGTPIVPIYVNAIHWPGPTPGRCYAFGQAIANVIADRLGEKRVALYASGGLSHFTAGYPWRVYRGPLGYGAISEEFDRRVLAWLADGRAEEIAKLSSQDLLNHGEIELRSWIILLGAVGSARAQVLAYEPLYRGLMGMGVARWTVGSQG
jgi:aromatic ring-opening dioxygenase catalytic subunit (LigB family)